MKVIKKEKFGIHPVVSTNVEDNGNYITIGGVINKNCIIDSDYQQEVHISLINVSKDSVKIYENDKIVQFIETPVYLDFVEEISEENFISYHKNSERTGGFGSTGN